MKKIICVLLLAFSTAYACGPFFPSSYISGMDYMFIENINIPMELALLAREYNLIDETRFPTGSLSAVNADLAEFKTAAAGGGRQELFSVYSQYSDEVRDESNSVSVVFAPAALTGNLREFALYLEGVSQMKNDPEIIAPAAWLKLLELPSANRKHRTVWVEYMLGNLASSHVMPILASKHYAACRQAVREGFADAAGLAAASYKREFLAQTNTVEWIKCGVQAVGYYQQADDIVKLKHCLNHLNRFFLKKPDLSKISIHPPLTLECTLIFLSGECSPQSDLVFEKLKTSPPLKTTSRLAWFLYKRGDAERASLYLKNCAEDDMLANWIRFRIAQRNGVVQKATQYLRRWFNELQVSDRVVFDFNDEYCRHKSRNTVHGILGNLLVTQGQMQEAMVCFVNAESDHDAALIAERYLETDSLKSYVDTFSLVLVTNQVNSFCNNSIVKNDESDCSRQNLIYLLARRLFRENRIEESLSYFSPELVRIATVYIDALADSEDSSLSADIRSAGLFHAARIMRRKGMELSGTELAPDYHITVGLYDSFAMDEEIKTCTNFPAIYRKTAPKPDKRFHYRYLAAELADRAADLARNRNQKATILWCAGEWIKYRDPKDANVYYKKLARISRSPLAKDAYKTHWFPMPTPKLKTISGSYEYIAPEILINAAKNYRMPPKI
jgi:hypothetical protein